MDSLSSEYKKITRLKLISNLPLLNLEDLSLAVDVLDLLVSDDLVDWENFHRLILWITFLFSLRLTEIDARKRSWNVKIR